MEKAMITPHTITIGSSVKIFWECPDCKYKWKSTIASRMKAKNRCARCAGLTYDYIGFEDACEFVRKLNLDGVEGWSKYWKANKILNIPRNADAYYKDSGWKGWSDFLGTKLREQGHPHFREAIKQSVKIAKQNALHTSSQWKEHVRKNNLRLPLCPGVVYGNKGWKGWSHWLGVEKVIYLPYSASKRKVSPLKIPSYSAWRVFARTEGLPSGVPRSPATYYKKNGWKGWGDFLGTNTVPTRDRKLELFFTMKQAMAFIREHKIKSRSQYRTLQSKHKKLPSVPSNTYKDEWKGWSYFINSPKGVQNQRKKAELYPLFDKLRDIAKENDIQTKKEWTEYCRKTDYIFPATVDRVFKNQWKGWDHFTKKSLDIAA